MQEKQDRHPFDKHASRLAACPSSISKHSEEKGGYSP